MTAEIIDFQKYCGRKLREREMSEPVPEAEIEQHKQSQKIIGEPGGDDGTHGGDTS